MEENVKQIEKYILDYYTDAKIDESKIITYCDFNKEIDVLENGVGIRNISYRNVFSLTGKDVLEFLNRIATNEMKSLPTAGIAHTLFTNEKGRILDRTTLIGLAGKYLLLSSCGCDTKLRRWIERYVVMEDVKINTVTGNYFILELYGYQAESFLTMFCGDAIDNVNHQTITLITLNDSQFFIYKKNENEITKYVLFTEFENSESVIKNIMSNQSVFNVSFVGERAFNYFRIRHGIPVTPNELNDSYNPHEAGLTREISDNKGCYIGQEVIARLETYEKVQRKLVGIIGEGKISINGELELPIVDIDENEIGTLTSCEYLPDQDRTIGLAYIRNKYLLETEKDFFVNKKQDKIKVITKDFPIKL